MNDRTDIAREMISLLRDTSPAGNHSDVSPDSPLGEQGLGLDSLALVKFITAVENQFDIEIPDEIWIDRGRLTLDDVIDVVAELQSPDLTATRRIEIQPAELAALSPRKKAATVIQKRGVFRAVGWMARRIMQRLLRTIYEKSVFYVLAFDLTHQALPSYTPPVEITFGTATLDDTDAVRGIWPDRQAPRKLASFRKRLNAGVTCYTATVDSTIASVDWVTDTETVESLTGLTVTTGPNACYGFDLAEHPDFRGRGIGLATLVHCIRETHRKGYRTHYTLVQAENERMLKTAVQVLGFAKVGEVTSTRIFHIKRNAWRFHDQIDSGMVLELP